MRYILPIPLARRPIRKIFGAANLYTLNYVKIMNRLKHFLGMDKNYPIGQLHPPKQDISSRIRTIFTRNPRMETSIGVSHKIKNFFSNLTSGKSQSRDRTEKSPGMPAQHIRQQPINSVRHNSIDPIEKMLNSKIKDD